MLPFLQVAPMDAAQVGTVSVRAEERYRIGNDVHAAETEITPQLKYELIWAGGSGHAVALYSRASCTRRPRIGHQARIRAQVNPETLNLDGSERSPVLAPPQRRSAALELIRPRWRLSAYQFAAYGEVTTTALLVDGAVEPVTAFRRIRPPIIPSTVAARFTLLFAQTQITAPIRLTHVASRSFRSSPTTRSAAPTAKARAAMALTQGPGASLGLEVAGDPKRSLPHHCRRRRGQHAVRRRSCGRHHHPRGSDPVLAPLVHEPSLFPGHRWRLSSAVTRSTATRSYGQVQASMIYDSWVQRASSRRARRSLKVVTPASGNHFQLGMGVKADAVARHLLRRARAARGRCHRLELHDRPDDAARQVSPRVKRVQHPGDDREIQHLHGGCRLQVRVRPIPCRSTAASATARKSFNERDPLLGHLGRRPSSAGVSWNPTPARF